MQSRLALVLLLASFAACLPEPDRATQLQQTIDGMAVGTYANPNPYAVTWGVTAAVTDEQPWFGAAGAAATNFAMRPDDRFHLASITKLYTTTIVMQLVDEGKVALDAPLATWLPEFPPQITLRHLLSHTSGIPDYLSDPVVLQQARSYWSPEDLEALFASYSLAFAPGTNASYSNSNFILLGIVIERVTESPYVEQLHQRILGPLQLANTGLDGFDGVPSVPGYDSNANDITLAIDPSLTWSAGGMISNTRDLSKFVTAMFRGQLFSAASLAAVTTPVGSIGGAAYGLGVSIYPTGAFGHNGSVPGFSTQVEYYPAQDGAVVLLANTFQIDAHALAEQVWTAGH